MEEVKLKQIELGTHVAAAIGACISQATNLAAAAQAAQDRYQSALNVHQEHLAGIIQDAGYKPEEFAQYAIVKEDGKIYLRAQQQRQQQ